MKKKKPGTGSKKKKGKHILSGPEAVASKKGFKTSGKTLDQNPFESIWTRQKQNVIGKKRKGEERRIGFARSISVNKRSKTLLKDYEQSRKASKFVDKRIGEGNDELGEYEKAIMRLQRERQLKLKKESKYNLADDEESLGLGNDDFSHFDDFNEEIPLDEDDVEYGDGESKKNRYLSLHSTRDSPEIDLLEKSENVHKTKKQVYEEIMAKSKFHKSLKAKGKEEDERLMEQLDNDFVSLAGSKALLSLTQPAKVTALKALLNMGNKEKSIASKPSVLSESDISKEKPDTYDRLVKEMALDIRAHPSDRTKTPEEIAQEERERLEQMEEERQKRMLFVRDDDDESNDDDSDENIYKSPSKKPKHISGDDLGLSFEDQPANKIGWADVIMEQKKAETDEESENEDDSDDDSESNNDEHSGSEGDSDNFPSMNDWEQSDEEPIADDNGDRGNMKKKGGDKEDDDSIKPTEKVVVLKDESLPFVIEAPRNLEELCLLLDHRSESEIVEAISRIRACNSIRLKAENRKKMQVFYGVLLQYFAVLATKKPINLNIINLFVKPLLEMSAETPYFAAICARQRLIRIRSQFCDDIKNSEKSSWPSLKTLMLLRLWSLIFPCSDFRHVVMTPATLMMCEYLMRCPIMSGRDIAVGSFLCSMILSLVKLSGKYCPEAVVFINILLMTATNMKQGMQQLSQCYYFMDLKTLKPWLYIQEKSSNPCPINFLDIIDLPADSSFYDSDGFRVHVLTSVTETLHGFVAIYENVNSFPEIFMPIAGLLDEVIKQSCIPPLLQSKIDDISLLIKKIADKTNCRRQPLQMRKKKPQPLTLLNPKFEENYVKGRDYDPDRERAERKKLKKLLKREAKGAARELRKDNYFLSEAKEKERMIHDEERSEKYGKARAFLQEQEHAYKSGQLGKGGKRKRR